MITNPHVSILANCIPSAILCRISQRNFLVMGWLRECWLLKQVRPTRSLEKWSQNKIPEKLLTWLNGGKTLIPAAEILGLLPGRNKEIPYDGTHRIFENAMAYTDDRREIPKSGYDAGCSIWSSRLSMPQALRRSMHAQKTRIAHSGKISCQMGNLEVCVATCRRLCTRPANDPGKKRNSKKASSLIARSAQGRKGNKGQIVSKRPR